MALGDLADLVDRLCIVNLKIWHLEESLRDTSKSDAEIGKLTRTLTPLNEERSALKNLLNQLTGLGSTDPKLYFGVVAGNGEHRPATDAKE